MAGVLVAGAPVHAPVDGSVSAYGVDEVGAVISEFGDGRGWTVYGDVHVSVVELVVFALMSERDVAIAAVAARDGGRERGGGCEEGNGERCGPPRMP